MGGSRNRDNRVSDVPVRGGKSDRKKAGKPENTSGRLQSDRSTPRRQRSAESASEEMRGRELRAETQAFLHTGDGGDDRTPTRRIGVSKESSWGTALLALALCFSALTFFLAINREVRGDSDRQQILKLQAQILSLQTDQRTTLKELRAALSAAGPAQRSAIEELITRITRQIDQNQRLLEIILRELRTHEREPTTKIIIQPSPYPSPVLVPCRVPLLGGALICPGMP
jgi:hypothetical protein